MLIKIEYSFPGIISSFLAAVFIALVLIVSSAKAQNNSVFLLTADDLSDEKSVELAKAG